MGDDVFMRRCLELAARGRGRTGINPMVGAVLVRGEKIVAEAWHEEFGRAHAERALLESFIGSIEPSDILYVNLEACCHRGKTLPCMDIIVERGVKNVIYGMDDPNPIVSGLGFEQLRKAGVNVRGPIERTRCEWLNRGFMSFIRKGRPWVTLKQARTRDGRIAKEDGSPLKITSVEQDHWSHQEFRAKHDAILVGVETIVRDDPELTVRFGDTSYQPLRIILDPRLRIPPRARVLSGSLAQGTLVVCAPGSDKAKRAELEKRGARAAEVPMERDHFSWSALWELLTTPKADFHGITSILVEGGQRTWEAFRAAGVVDEEVILVGRA